jgi:hypothetical protein
MQEGSGANSDGALKQLTVCKRVGGPASSKILEMLPSEGPVPEHN